jgi:ribosomal protein S4
MKFKRQSEYGKALEAKQAVKAFYGALTEGQFQDLYAESVRISFQRSDSTTLEYFIGCLESRVDVLLYRSGLATSVAHANQWVSHGKVSVNGRRVHSSGLPLKSGDCLSVLSATSFQSGFFGLKTASVSSGVNTGLKGSKVSVGKGKGSGRKNFVAKGKKMGPAVVFGGHFVVSPKLASLIYLRPPKLDNIPNYPFVGKRRRGRFGSAPVKNPVNYIAETNGELYTRVVSFCARR